MNKTTRLQVSTPQGGAGLLQKESRFVFNYETADRTCEVSLVMPLRAESYADGALFSVFAMNRPEGYLLDALRERFAKVMPLTDMELLRLTGQNQVGRLRYRLPEGNPARPARTQVRREEIIGSTQSDEMFRFLTDAYLESSGVSGFQPKVLVPDSATIDEKSSVITSDLIVKAAGDGYPFLAQNEFLCMEAARLACIAVPPFWLSGDGKLFIMSRFDIQGDTQLGLEDMVVLMGKSGDEKYHGSYEGIARAIGYFCGGNAGESLGRLFEYVALSCLVRNGDAHLKNFSLLYDVPGGNIRLSPLYDVVTTTVYEISNPRTGATKVDRTLALNLNKTKRYPLPEELIAFGEKVCMVRHPLRVIERIQEAKREACDLHTDRVDPVFMAKIRHEWDTEKPKIS